MCKVEGCDHTGHRRRISTGLYVFDDYCSKHLNQLKKAKTAEALQMRHTLSQRIIHMREERERIDKMTADLEELKRHFAKEKKDLRKAVMKLEQEKVAGPEMEEQVFSDFLKKQKKKSPEKNKKVVVDDSDEEEDESEHDLSGLEERLRDTDL